MRIPIYVLRYSILIGILVSCSSTTQMEADPQKDKETDPLPSWIEGKTNNTNGLDWNFCIFGAYS